MVDIINNKKFHNNAKNYFNFFDIKNRVFTVFKIYYQIFNKMLIVNKLIKKQVYKFLKYFSTNSFIGIQIRAGNDELNEKKRIDARDVDIMVNMAKKYKKYKIWYLTGDSIKYKQILCRTFNNIVVYTNNRTNHYDKFKKDNRIIIEHEILSKAKFLIVSRSTFGKTALLKSGLALANLTYVVTNGSVFDAQNEYFS